MKKLFVTFLAALLAMSFSCISYAEEATGNTDAITCENTAETDAGKTAWAATDEEGLYTTLGFEFNVPMGAEDLEFYMDEADKIGEMTFTLNGIDYTARIARTSETANVPDISGLNYTWTTTLEGTLDNEPSVYMETADSCNAASVLTWVDTANGLAYSLATDQNGMGEEALEKVAVQTYTQVVTAAEV